MELEGKFFFYNGKKWIVKKRKNQKTKGNKPEYYAVEFRNYKNYLSSIYPVEPEKGIFNFDDRESKKPYLLIYKGNTFEIKET
mgnify:CR=1 FL=1|jgi:hypothetical protein